MARVHKLICMTVVIWISFLYGQATTYAQNVEATREPSTRDGGGVPKAPSATRRVLLNIAKAVVEVLCAEYGDCPSSGDRPAETTSPDSREGRAYRTPSFVGGNSRPAPRGRGFSFDTPPGWQTYEDQASVTVAQPSEYTDGNLTNGVILGLSDLNSAGFEAGAEAYVRGLLSNNKYLKRIGWPERNVVDNVPCVTSRMEGLSPKTHYTEKVVVYACRRSSQQLFYVVTVNSGPDANRYDEHNLHITQSVSFR